MAKPLCHDGIEARPLVSDAENEQWERCFRYTSRGIAITDTSTNLIERVNPAFAEMHRGRPEDFVGTHVTELFAVGDREAALRRTRTTDAGTNLRSRAPSRTSRTRTISLPTLHTFRLCSAVTPTAIRWTSATSTATGV